MRVHFRIQYSDYSECISEFILDTLNNNSLSTKDILHVASTSPTLFILNRCV